MLLCLPLRISWCRILWSAASTTRQIRIAGSGNRGMNSGTMSLTARIATTISVFVRSSTRIFEGTASETSSTAGTVWF